MKIKILVPTYINKNDTKNFHIHRETTLRIRNLAAGGLFAYFNFLLSKSENDAITITKKELMDKWKIGKIKLEKALSYLVENNIISISTN